MSKNINIYICIVFMLIILILLNTTSQKNKIQGGEEESAVDSLLENSVNINKDELENIKVILERERIEKLLKKLKK